MKCNPNIILSAGMQRSGSTWLYNAARLLLSDDPQISKSLSCCWVEDLDKVPDEKYILIKIHEFESEIVQKSNFVFYSYRDIRDSLASGVRKFSWVPTVEMAGHLIDQYKSWVEVSDYVMKY